MGVFDIHDLVANVVGGFDEIHQRVARIADAIALMFEGGDAQGVENREKGVAFGREEAHFRFIAGQCGRKGVLDHRSEGGIRHDEAAFAPTVEAMREQTEGIGVTVEVSDVVPGGFGEELAVWLSRALGEEGANGLFARVTEGRIAHIVRQTGGRHDGADTFEGGCVGGVVASFQSARHIRTQ